MFDFTTRPARQEDLPLVQAWEEQGNFPYVVSDDEYVDGDDGDDDDAWEDLEEEEVDAADAAAVAAVAPAGTPPAEGSDGDPGQVFARVWRYWLQDAKSAVMVVDMFGRPTCLARAVTTGPRQACIEALEEDPGHFAQGLIKTLLFYVRRTLAERGVRHVTTWLASDDDFLRDNLEDTDATHMEALTIFHPADRPDASEAPPLEKAAPADADAVVACWDKAADASRFAKVPRRLRWMVVEPEVLRARVADGDVWIMRSGGAVDGFVIGTPGDDWLDFVACDAEHRGQLLDRLRAWRGTVRGLFPNAWRPALEAAGFRPDEGETPSDESEIRIMHWAL